MKPREVHGDYGKRLFITYNNMKQRCNNKKFKQWQDYGGRGILVCDEWLNSYITFKTWALVNGYSDELTLDRLNNNEGYYPENCRWVDHFQQRKNSRIRKDNTSGIRGISFRKDTHKYFAYIWKDKKRKSLGCYLTLETAKLAREIAEKNW